VAEPIENICICNDLGDLPSFTTLQAIPRGVKLKVLFGSQIEHLREKLGNQWKTEHKEFQIGIHTGEPVVSFVKCITDEEITLHQLFFEKCAQDYRNLATSLIRTFADRHALQIDSDYPMNTLSHTRRHGYEPVGQMDDWRYAFHGIHCAFTNLKTGQHIEVPLTYGLEFGELDPYFFIRFIETTKAYRPLPVEMYCDYSDGERILHKMIDLGMFEYVNSNWPDRYGIVVKDRERVEVKVLEIERSSAEQKQRATFISKLKKWWSKA
jgi:hypothetical protein